MLEREQLLVERALEHQVLDGDGESRMTVGAVPTTKKRYALEWLGLHANAAHLGRVHDVDARRVQDVDARGDELLPHGLLRDDTVELGHGGDHVLLHLRVGLWLDLQVAQLGLGHVQTDDETLGRLHHALLARLPHDAVAVSHVLARLGEDDGHRQVRRVLEAPHDQLARVGAVAMEHVEPAALALEHCALAAQADVASVRRAERARDRAVESARAARAVGRPVVHERGHNSIHVVELHARQHHCAAELRGHHEEPTVARV